MQQYHVLPKWHLYLVFGCAPLRPAAVSRPARLRGSHRLGTGLNERGSRRWAPARLRLARQPRGCPVTGSLDFLGRCANRPGRRAPSTCGDAEVRGVPLLVCCRRGGGVAGRPSRPRHAGAPAPRPLPPRYRPFGSRAVGRRGGSRGRRCAPAVGGRGDHLSPGLRRLGGPARPPCASRGRMPRGAFARGRFWYRRGGAAWAGAAQPLAVGVPAAWEVAVVGVVSGVPEWLGVRTSASDAARLGATSVSVFADSTEAVTRCHGRLP